MSHALLVAGGEIRVAFRDEGEYTVAYLARVGTMQDAIEISRMRSASLREDQIDGTGVLKEMWTTILASWLEREIKRHQLPGGVTLDWEDENHDEGGPLVH